ncbi:ribosome biogenesis protein SLX9-domain-containing protein [Lophiotrema nucula]|uniref:Ribosome biogenesis protein SLX9 n=1 Tax=Lophiotrema nucula TaxID=690887 RepID=A0A6A5YYR8_9PLEO|nr:ribosome biogenesis protein SLX9-domain-containing protein [Lophiotrema nucula]
MAPTQGKKRTSARAKAAARPSKAQLPIPDQAPASYLFPSSKKDKRAIKHSAFVGKIEKASKPKRRRPNKKLVANLESLADALAEVDHISADGEIELGQAKIQRKSLRSRPGAMKRKEKLERMERERFNKNLAQMAGNSASAGTTSIADRWAALKSHVQGTVEKKPEFVKT